MKRSFPNNPDVATTLCSSLSLSSSTHSSRSSSTSSLIIQQINNNNIDNMNKTKTTTMKTTTQSNNNSITINNNNSNNDSFSYNLGLSLKRVKISTTPGELRLMKDIDQLITKYQWKVIPPPWNNNNTMEYNITNNNDNSKHDLLSPSNTIRMDRDPVDALRLRVRIRFSDSSPSPDENTSKSPFSTTTLATASSNPKELIFLIQIPRMYPHTPPIIYRISSSQSDLTCTTEFDVSTNINTTGANSRLCNTISSVPPPFSMEEDDDDHDHNPLSPAPQHKNYPFSPPIIKQMSTKIIITQNPKQIYNPNYSNNHNKISNKNADNNCIIFHGWSAINTLYDLFHWLEESIVPTIKLPCPQKHKLLFPQNRFDTGYNTATKKKNSVIGMDLE